MCLISVLGIFTSPQKVVTGLLKRLHNCIVWQIKGSLCRYPMHNYICTSMFLNPSSKTAFA